MTSFTHNPPADLGAALSEAESQLAAAGVPSPRADAELLAGHLMGATRGEVAAAALRGSSAPSGLAELVAERVRRVPLQHLVGAAQFRGVQVRVGPGVFIPRPETEMTAGAAIDAARAVVAAGRRPVVIDLCSGSGAIAMAVADEVPEAEVHAQELAPEAHAWAERNVEGGRVQLRIGDAAAAFPELTGAVDVVVANPPYIPTGMVPVDPEVYEHDPAVSLFGGGDDGLDVPRAVVENAWRLLRPGGELVMEHGDVQQDAVLAVLRERGWTAPTGHVDLAGRPRYVTASRPQGVSADF